MLYRSALPKGWLPGSPVPHPVRDEQHAVAILLKLTHAYSMPPRLAVPVRGFTSTWKRLQPYAARPDPPPRVHTQILQTRQEPPGRALHEYRKRARLAADAGSAARVPNCDNDTPTHWSFNDDTETAQSSPHTITSTSHPVADADAAAAGNDNAIGQNDDPTVMAPTVQPSSGLGCGSLPRTIDHDLTFLTERRNQYKAVRLRFARRQLVAAAALGCPAPIILYSTTHGALAAAVGESCERSAQTLRSSCDKV